MTLYKYWVYLVCFFTQALGCWTPCASTALKSPGLKKGITRRTHWIHLILKPSSPTVFYFQMYHLLWHFQKLGCSMPKGWGGMGEESEMFPKIGIRPHTQATPPHPHPCKKRHSQLVSEPLETGGLTFHLPLLHATQSLLQSNRDGTNSCKANTNPLTDK